MKTVNNLPVSQNNIPNLLNRPDFKRSLSDGDLKTVATFQPAILTQPILPPQPSEKSPLLSNAVLESPLSEENETKCARVRKAAFRHVGCAIGTAGCCLAIGSGFMAAGGLSAGAKAVWSAVVGNDPFAWASAGLGLIGCGMELYQFQKKCEVKCCAEDQNGTNTPIAQPSHPNAALTPPVNNVRMTISPNNTP